MDDPRLKTRDVISTFSRGAEVFREKTLKSKNQDKIVKQVKIHVITIDLCTKFAEYFFLKNQGGNDPPDLPPQ